MIGLLFLFGILCLFCSCFSIDDRIHQHYNEQQHYIEQQRIKAINAYHDELHEQQRIKAMNAYHDELQRQLAISETKVKLQEMEKKIKKLTTDT